MAKARTGNRQPDPPEEIEEEEGEFNDAQIGRITNIVNAAVSGQLQRKLPKAIGDAVAGPIGELRTLIEGQGTGRRRDDEHEDDPEDPPAQRGKTKAGRTRAADPDPEKENMKQRLAAIESERKLEREQNRNRDRDTTLRESLTKLGVDPNRIRGAVAVLRDSTKYDEKTGEWSYIAKRDGYDEDVDLSQGAKEWAGTDEGKSYLAPPQRGAGGSGTRLQPGMGAGTGTGGGGRPIADPKAAKVQAKQDAVAKLGEAVNALGGGTIGLG